MDIDRIIEIAATRERVWSVATDVETLRRPSLSARRIYGRSPAVWTERTRESGQLCRRCAAVHLAPTSDHTEAGRAPALIAPHLFFRFIGRQLPGTGRRFSATVGGLCGSCRLRRPGRGHPRDHSDRSSLDPRLRGRSARMGLQTPGEPPTSSLLFTKANGSGSHPGHSAPRSTFPPRSFRPCSSRIFSSFVF
jgi:hypothetical protein